MIYRVKLDNALKRSGLLLGLLGFVTCMGWFISRHFVIRTLADQRLNFSREIITPAVARLPASALLRKRLAEAYLAGDEPDYEQASVQATQAVKLTPRDGRAWYLLGLAQEGQGLAAEAEQSLWQAAALAPADSAINWALANLLVRVGKVDESVSYFRRAVTLNGALFSPAFDTLWQAGGRKLELLQAIASEHAATRVALAHYLVEQKLYAKCLEVFQVTDWPALAALPQTNDLLNRLLAEQQPLIAHSLWVNVQKAQPSAVNVKAGELIWDGGFETEILVGLPHFAWLLQDSDFARVGYDDTVAHQGQHSLKMLLTGHDTTVLGSEIQQRLALQPGRRYRLEAFVKTESLVAAEGPLIALKQNDQVTAQTAPLTTGTQDWQRIVLEFVAPPHEKLMVLTIIRTPKLAYDPPMKGALWFDDFTMVELEN